MQSSKSCLHLWWIPVLVPLVLVFSAFITETWFWGLMDDHRMVVIPGSVGDRFHYLDEHLRAAGRFYPTFIFHLALFYKVFASNPLAFFIFRFFEVVLALGLWGYLAYKVTDQKFAAPLCVAITLSFYRFYDAFFYLSTQEILGVMFAGAAGLLFYRSIFAKERIGWGSYVGGIFFLLLAYTSKEPFVSVGVAFGISILGLGIFQKKKKTMMAGAGLFVFSLGYALVLKLFIMQGYSASYSLGWEKLSTNGAQWFKQVFLKHLPWIIATGIVSFIPTEKSKRSAKNGWALSLGALLYLIYLLMILPWSGTGHYVTPLAIFFAFFITILLIQKLSRIQTVLGVILVVASLGLNIYVGGKATHFHSAYQRDTVKLLEWLSQNTLFKNEVMQRGAKVRCNANEPCTALGNLLESFYDTNYESFIFTPNVGEIMRDPQTRYYIWSPSWGDQDLRRLKNMWTPMFTSESWYVFRRMI